MTISSLAHLFQRGVRLHPERSLLFFMDKGRYYGMTWLDVEQYVSFSLGYLLSLGIAKGDRVAIMSKNCPEWVIVDLAVLILGAVTVPIYPTLSSDQLKFILKDSDPKALFLGDVLLSDLKVTNQFLDGACVKFKDVDLDGFIAMTMFYKQGETFFSENKVSLDDYISQRTYDDLASIVYTSGTTGVSKGVKLTHGNFLTNVFDIIKALPLEEGKERVLSFLPLAHVFERTAGYYVLLAIYGEIYYAEDIATITRDLLLANPTIVLSVPRLYEKMKLKSLATFKSNWIKSSLFSLAFWGGYRKNVLKVKNNVSVSLVYYLCSRPLFSLFRRKLGTSLKFFVSGGAPLEKAVAEFFLSMDVLIIEGYGLTETSPVIACNSPCLYKFGTVGRLLSSLDFSFDDGELLVKGPSIATGYWGKNSQPLLSDGDWFHTGDLGFIDSEGFITITGRKKDLIVLSNGKNVAPLSVELALNESDIFSQMLIIGNSKQFISALFVLDKNYLDLFSDLAYKDNCIYSSKLYADLEFKLASLQAKLSPFERVKAFRVIKESFTEENAMLTPTMKLRRHVIEKKYESVIQSMYN